MTSSYAAEREANIKKNRELLESLGLHKPIFEPTEKPIKRKPKQQKRKASEEEETADTSEGAEDAPKAKARRVEGQTPEGGPRRSSRNAGKTVDYKAEIVKSIPLPLSYRSGVKDLPNEGPLGREDGRRTQDPKQYGHIPGIEVGTWWEGRKGCSVDAVHAPLVAGISGGANGAHSVALSGGYEDDVDLGYAFTYTGSGGRDLKGTKNAPKNLRTAPQSSDQTFENTFNKMLLRSSKTKKPVRVVRGFKLKSKYGPSEGYRYDGLYVVEKAWSEKGLNPKGYLVCKFAFKRLPGQPALPIRNLDQPAKAAKNADESGSADEGETEDAELDDKSELDQKSLSAEKKDESVADHDDGDEDAEGSDVAE